MKFVKQLSSRGTVKKAVSYEFDFTEEDVKKGMQANRVQPHFTKSKSDGCWFALFKYDGNLVAQMFHSYDLFVRLN